MTSPSFPWAAVKVAFLLCCLIAVTLLSLPVGKSVVFYARSKALGVKPYINNTNILENSQRSAPLPPPPPPPPPPKISKPKRPLPSMALAVVSFHKHAHALEWMMYTMSMFWPSVSPAFSWLKDLHIILDEESPREHELGNCLLAHHPSPTNSNISAASLPFPMSFNIQVHYNALPPNWQSLFPGSYGRGKGYDRQQYVSFYLDKWATADIIGIMDSDSVLFSTPTPESVLDERGRIRIQSVFFPSLTVWDRATFMALRVHQIMDISSQRSPLLLWRDTFRKCREHIVRVNNVRTFEEAFGRFSNVPNGMYSQFNILYNFAYFYEPEKYLFHYPNSYQHNEYGTFFRPTHTTFLPALDFGRNGLFLDEVALGCCQTFSGMVNASLCEKQPLKPPYGTRPSPYWFSMNPEFSAPYFESIRELLGVSAQTYAQRCTTLLEEMVKTHNRPHNIGCPCCK